MRGWVFQGRAFATRALADSGVAPVVVDRETRRHTLYGTATTRHTLSATAATRHTLNGTATTRQTLSGVTP